MKKFALQKTSPDCGTTNISKRFLVPCTTACAIAYVYNASDDTVVSGCAAEDVLSGGIINEVAAKKFYIMEICSIDRCNDHIRNSSSFSSTNITVLLLTTVLCLNTFFKFY
ncbi:unnamed protein product [Bursaphelenchus okinawaensis]|uniref:Uncharacterized protein n=1 Tax=Bursaphelenchus okinawaensis TaxID=465554 RepID=A0A811LQI8_9BILA|nr:unnamed protein product [Bursaphelenchus okinawaensis]CAG9127324.1 unnamed protein product [Bursaphelenchus okinawaensis]